MVKTFALVVGIAFLAVGLLGLINNPTGGWVLGTFAVNLLHNLIHLIVGIAGVATYYLGWRESRIFCQVLGVIYLLIGLLGLIPPLTPDGELLGLVRVNTADNLLHLVIGGIAAYLGFSPQYRREPMRERFSR